jgi:hypothetical protein
MVRPDADTHLEVKLVVRRARPGRDGVLGPRETTGAGRRVGARGCWVVVLSPERFVTNKLPPNWRPPGIWICHLAKLESGKCQSCPIRNAGRPDGAFFTFVISAYL